MNDKQKISSAFFVHFWCAVCRNKAMMNATLIFYFESGLTRKLSCNPMLAWKNWKKSLKKKKHCQDRQALPFIWWSVEVCQIHDQITVCFKRTLGMTYMSGHVLFSSAVFLKLLKMAVIVTAHYQVILFLHSVEAYYKLNVMKLFNRNLQTHRFCTPLFNLYLFMVICLLGNDEDAIICSLHFPVKASEQLQVIETASVLG